METLSEALERLTATGYTEDYRAESLGLRGRSGTTVHSPEGFEIDQVVRFEGDSDPSDESAIFALTLQHDGIRRQRAGDEANDGERGLRMFRRPVACSIGLLVRRGSGS